MLPVTSVYEMRGTSSAPSTCSATLAPTTTTVAVGNTLHALPSFASHGRIPAPPSPPFSLSSSPLLSQQQQRQRHHHTNRRPSSPILSSLNKERPEATSEAAAATVYGRPHTHFQLAPYNDKDNQNNNSTHYDLPKQRRNSVTTIDNDYSPAPRRPLRSPPSRDVAIRMNKTAHVTPLVNMDIACEPPSQPLHKLHRQPLLSQTYKDTRHNKYNNSLSETTRETKELELKQSFPRHSFPRQTIPNTETHEALSGRRVKNEKAMMELTSYGAPRTMARPAAIPHMHSADRIALNDETMSVKTCVAIPGSARHAAPALRSARTRSVSLHPAMPTTRRHVAFDPCSLQEAFLRRMTQKLWRWVGLCGMKERHSLPCSVRGHAEHGFMPLPIAPQVTLLPAESQEHRRRHGSNAHSMTSKGQEGKCHVQHVVVKVVRVTVLSRSAGHHTNRCTSTGLAHTGKESTVSTALGRETRLTQPALCTRLLRLRERTIKCVARLTEVLPLAAILYNDDNEEDEENDEEEEENASRGVKSHMRSCPRRTARPWLSAQMGSTASQVAAITEDIRRELAAVLSAEMSQKEENNDIDEGKSARTREQSSPLSYSRTHNNNIRSYPQATLFLYVRRYMENAHTLSAALREAWPFNVILHGYYHAVPSRSLTDVSEAGVNETPVQDDLHEENEQRECEERQQSQRVKVVGKPFSLDEIADIALQVATGLLYLHEYDICHGNLKPSNVLLRDSDTTNTAASLLVHLTDFGLPLFPDTLIERVPLFIQESTRRAHSERDMYTARVDYSRLLSGKSHITPITTTTRCLRGFVRLRKVAQQTSNNMNEPVSDTMDATRRPPSDLNTTERSAELVMLQHLMAPECCLVTCANNNSNNEEEESRVWVNELRKSPASDAYALGVLLYMMLRGRFPPLPPYAQAVRVPTQTQQHQEEEEEEEDDALTSRTAMTHLCDTRAVYVMQAAPKLYKPAYYAQLWATTGEESEVHTIVNAELKEIVEGLLDPDPDTRLDLRQLRCSLFFRQYGQHRFVLQQLYKASHAAEG